MRLIQKQLPLLLAALFLFTVGCKKKEEDPQQPAQTSLSTFIPTSVDFTSVTLKGSILTVGDGGITDHGFVWGETASPDLNSAGKHSLGAKSEAGAFEHAVTGLTAGKTYHVRAYATDAQGTVYGEDKTFSTTNSPTITEFTPTEAGQGDTVTIKGTNFNATTAETSIKFGTTAATTILSVSETEIKVVVPSGVTEGANKITATIKGLEAASTTDFTYLLGTWTQKKDFGGVARTDAVSFSVGTKGYILGGRTEYNTSKGLNDMWEYDTATDTWTQKANYPGGKRTLPVAFVLQDIAFVGLGTDDNNVDKKDFWQYKPADNTWTQLNDFAGTISFGRNFAFSLGSKGYVIKHDSNELWEVSLNTWTQKNNLPASNFRGHFVLNGVAYIVAKDKKAWKYNDSNDTWTSVASFPGKDFVNHSFSVSNIGYLTESVSSSTITFGLDNSKLWKYSPTSDSWQRARTLTDNSKKSWIFSDVFVIGSKAYIRTGSFNGVGLWEFDPAK
ncbi:IPT/TIG domain-containing protein [Microscilla marina]|uniref:IPT/TIG domain protein n=1 Tax=Microscilla marina ATCC 23134 TaxID=313606 RepID=A1ZTE1_MICM2|nr:IPT/TIG domain-containing protein [Microscilla marina]EAY26363.1 IPT/TIG domain protein [Microscilla marina ATCC 23134]